MGAKKKMLQALDMGNNTITGLPTPTEASDAATRQFVLDNAGGNPSATQVSFTPEANTFPAGTDNVDEALKELFTYANSGKSTIAGVIGSPAQSSDSFATLAGYITTAKTNLDAFVDSAEGTTTGSETLAQLTAKLDQVRVFKRITKFVKTNGQTGTLPLKQYNGAYPTLDKTLVMPLVRINDGSTTQTIAEFNNGDSGSFDFDIRYVQFGTVSGQQVASLKNDYTYTPTNTQSLTSGTLYTYSVEDIVNFTACRNLQYDGTTLEIEAIPVPQLIKANSNIPLTNVQDILSATSTLQLIGVPTGGFEALNPRMAVSFDGGANYYNWNFTSNTPLAIVVTSSAFDSNDYSHTNFTLMTIADWDTLRNGSNNIRFAYLLKDQNYGIKTNLNTLALSVVISGSFVPITDTNKTGSVTTSYNANTGIVTLTYGASDAYMINYIDTP